MADDCSSKRSHRSFDRSLSASGLKPQNQISFQEFKVGTLTKQEDKPNMTIDLRHPRLIHLYSSENGSVAPTGLGGPSNKAVPPSDRHSRPQTARRGGGFHGFGVQGYCRSKTVSDVRSSAADKAGDSGAASSSFGHVRSHDDPQSLCCSQEPDCTAAFVNPKSADNSVGHQVSHSVGLTDIIDVTAFTQLDASVPILSVSEENVTNYDISNQPSTIIHLKLVAASSGREETEGLVDASSSRRQEKKEAFRITPCVIQEENLDDRRSYCLSKDSVGVLNPDPTTDQNIESRVTKRKMGDVSDCHSSTDDDDLPLIVHCKRSKKGALEKDGSRDSGLVHEVKRTYERGNTGQHGSVSTVGQGVDSQKSLEKRGITYEKSRGGETVVAGSGREGLETMEEPWKKSVQSRQSGGSSSRQRQLEEYERNNFALRNAGDGKTASARKVRLPGKTQSDGESIRNSKRPPSQIVKPLPLVTAKKTQVLRYLKSGPVSLKRKQMKELGVNPKMMAQVLRELTERKCSVGRTSVSFMCSSHQNYYDSCFVYRLTERPPAKEKVTVHVPAGIKDDLDPVGKEALVLWRISDSEVEELQKQVKQEMEHKRTEHIMPMVLQMSYEQIETAYEQVKKDMKTYEITENDSDIEDEEEDDEEDKQKDDDEEEQEDEEEGRNEERGKDNERLLEAEGDKAEELENDAGENLHVRSYDIIVHDESSKTISCETVKYLEWRKKHPSFDNSTSDTPDKEKENSAVFDTGVENNPPFESHNAVEHAATTAKQTSYSRSRPKRHAVDYSPDAFAPIRLMEGKRLGGKKALPAKPQNKKKTVNDTRHGKQSSRRPSETSERVAEHCGLKGDEKNHKNGSSGKVRKHESDTKAGHRSHGLQKTPRSPHREVGTSLCDFTSENTVGVVSPDREASTRAGRHHNDVASDDEFPVILDVPDNPLSPATNSSAAPKQPPSVCEHDGLDKPLLSEYEVVRNEYMRLRDLTQAGAVDDETVLSDALVSGACDNGVDHDDEVRSVGEKLHQKEVKDVLVSSSENVTDENNPGKESSDPSVIHLEAFAPTQNPADGGCLANMPSLQRHCMDILGTEAEEPLAPPDLGLPIECLNSQQRPASPVLPPVLEVEATGTKDGEDRMVTTPNFLLISSCPDSGIGGGDGTVLCDSIVGDVH